MLKEHVLHSGAVSTFAYSRTTRRAILSALLLAIFATLGSGTASVADDILNRHAMKGDATVASIPPDAKSNEPETNDRSESVEDRLGRLTNMLYQQGRFREAVETARQLVDARRKQSGDSHPKLAASLNNLGEICRAQAEYAAADSAFQEASKIVGDAFGEDDTRVAAVALNQGLLYSEMGQFDKADALLAKATVVLREKLGERHPRYALALNNQGFLCRQRGQDKEAASL